MRTAWRFGLGAAVLANLVAAPALAATPTGPAAEAASRAPEFKTSIAEYEAARILGLNLTTARQAGYDATGL